MDEALLFENLLCKNLGEHYDNVAAAMYNACLSETETYRNGYNVGRVSSLMSASLDVLQKRESLSNADKRFIESCKEEIETTNSYEKLSETLQALYERNILF